MMKKIYFFAILSLMFAGANAQILAWQFGVPASAGNEATYTATTINANLNTSVLSRGAGVTASPLVRAFSSTNFTASGTKANAITTNQYMQFTVSAQAGFKVSLSTLDARLRRSSTGPNAYIWRYSIDGTNFTDIGTDISFTSTADGVDQTQIDLSVIAALQNVASGTTITLRIYAWGASATGGTFAIGRYAATVTTNSLAIGGTVLPLAGNSITTGAVGTPPFCVDAVTTAAGTVAYTTTGTFAGQTIIAKLSDAAGSFAAPVNIGSTAVTGVDPSGSISITIPAGTPTGTGYKIRIDEATLPITGSESAAFKIVNGVENITGLGSSFTVTTVTLNWTNPSSCFDEVLIVAKPLTTIAGVPAGDGTAYTADLNFLGSGSSFDGTGKVVYKGTISPQTVTNLTTGVAYFFRVFSRKGTNWSGGVEISVTPSIASSPTDFFRTLASGSWSTQTTWESSNDSTTWIPATLLPGAAAAHVVVRSPDSVWLSDLRTTANLTIMSGAKFNATTFTLTATVRFNLLGTASYYQGGTVSLVPGVAQVLSPTSNFYYNGAQNGLAALLPEFGNLFFEPTPTGSNTIQNTNLLAPFYGGLVVRGNMTINLGAAFQIRFATGTTVSRTHTIDGNLNVMGSNTIAVIQQGASPSTTTGTVNIGGNLNISGGAVFQALSSTAANGGNAIVNLKGNINNTGGTMQSGASTAGFDTLNFVGITPQSISNTGGTFNFTNRQTVTLNNAAGLTLNTPISILGKVDFTSGIVTTTATNLLTMAAGSSVAGASNASFVFGPVKKIGNTAFTFPVGKANGYVPIGIGNFFGSTAGDEFTAEYMRASARALGPITAGPGLTTVSGCDYWKLDKGLATPTSADITAYWNTNNPCSGTYISNPNTVTIAHFDGAGWDLYAIPTIITGGSTAAAGSVTWPGATQFSPFSLASTVLGDNPLPITINYFNGSKNNGNHLLNWKVTCVSTPSATLEMQLSTDGRNYNSIYSIFATAVRCQQPFDYTDNQPAKGVNYYRLKMTDVDGKITYSSIVSLINAVKGIEIMNIAPNPIVNGGFNLKVSTAEKTQMELVISDMQGRILQKQTVSMIAGFNSIPVNVRNLAAGTYHVFGNTTDGRTSVLSFVIQ